MTVERTASTSKAGLLRNRSFRRVWISSLVSDGGDWLLFIALPLVVLRLSGSAVGTSLAFLLELVPGAAATPIAGWCADRFDARRFLPAVAVAQAVVLLPLTAIGTLPRGAALVAVYAVIAVEALLTAVSDPTRNALLPRLVESGELVGANSLAGLAQNLGRLVGGPLGGLVLAVGGLTAVVLADLASYLVAAVLLFGVAPARRSPPSEEPRAEVGARAVLRLRAARRLLAITFGCQIAQGMFLVLFVLFVVRTLHGGSGEVGLLRGVQAVGAIAAALGVAALARRASPALLVAWSTVAFGVISLLSWNAPALTRDTGLYAVLFVLAGAPGVVLGTGLVSGLQRDVPASLHGRAFALSGLASYAGQGLGIVAAGVLTGAIGLRVALDIQAGVYLLVGAIAVVTARAAPLAPKPPARAARRREQRAARP